MRRDFESIKEGDWVTLYPIEANVLHPEPVRAYFDGRFFFCDGSPPEDGPDYTIKDAARFTRGFEMASAE